jgi:predicted short-subunit dehydrogenase-like oxidoreductase (DUF2520 family)
MNPSPLKVALIGAGNLAWSLIPNLQKAGVEVSQLISRSPEKRRLFGEAYAIPHLKARPQELHPAVNLVFLTVSDHAIASVAAQLKGCISPQSILVHTSGSIAMDELAVSGARTGVFYPLQTFTTQVVVDFQEVPLFLEGAGQTELHGLARQLSNRVFPLDSTDRLRLHLGAVVACNFTNYLYQLAQDLMPQKEGIDFSIYEALVREQVDKAFRFQPQNTQTGPAIRGDLVTLQKHFDLLQDQPEAQELYRQLSLRINPKLEL